MYQVDPMYQVYAPPLRRLSLDGMQLAATTQMDVWQGTMHA